MYNDDVGASLMLLFCQSQWDATNPDLKIFLTKSKYPTFRQKKIVFIIRLIPEVGSITGKKLME